MSSAPLRRSSKTAPGHRCEVPPRAEFDAEVGPVRHPRPVKLLPHLYEVGGAKLSHPYDANVLLITGKVPTLIDCGSTLGYPALKKNLAALGLSIRDIRQVVITHGHWDHCSAAAQIQKESGAKILIGAADAKTVAHGKFDESASFLYRHEFPPVKPDGRLRHGQKLPAGDGELEIIATPGHTPGSLCALAKIDGMDVLFAGDTLYGGCHVKVKSDLEAWRRSLDVLTGYHADVMVPGHIPPGMIFDADGHILEARDQFGEYFNPWFKGPAKDYSY